MHGSGYPAFPSKMRPAPWGWSVYTSTHQSLSLDETRTAPSLSRSRRANLNILHKCTRYITSGCFEHGSKSPHLKSTKSAHSFSSMQASISQKRGFQRFLPGKRAFLVESKSSKQAKVANPFPGPYWIEPSNGIFRNKILTWNICFTKTPRPGC